jgi:peptide/nickel transport system substrate-binding protein
MLVPSDADTLDPRYSTDAVALRVTRLAHAGLVRLDPDSLAPEPYLATGWRWRDPLTLEVDLRSDVRFHSGAPFTSRDVTATLRAFASPEVGSRHARVVETIADAREEGPHRVVVRLARPHATLLTDLELPILRADQASSPPDPSGALDGLGPYRVAGFERGEIRLEPADGAALPRPAHAVTIRTVHDENARALRLWAGRADLVLNAVSPTLLPAMNESRGLHVTSRPGSNLTYLVVRHGRGPLDDARVRQAVSLAIDRAMLASTLFGGHAHPAGSAIPPVHWAHVEGAPPLPFDPDAARALLASAGMRDVHLTLLLSTDRLRSSVARVVAQELADVGVAIELVPLEIGTMLARLNAGDFDLAMLQLPEFTEPNLLRHFFHSRFVPPAGGNRGRVSDPELDAWLDRGEAVSDPDERRRIYAHADARMIEEMHLVPLFYEDQVAVTSDRAQAFVPSAEGRWLSLAGLD